MLSRKKVFGTDSCPDKESKISDPEIPIGMPRPLHIQLITPIKPQFDVLALELIDDRPVVNPLNQNPFPAPLVIKPRPILSNVTILTVRTPNIFSVSKKSGKVF